jgi:hypothetical protein
MLNHLRSFAGVPKPGTKAVQIFTPQFAIIAPQNTGARQGIMDDTCQYKLPFQQRFDDRIMLR